MHVDSLEDVLVSELADLASAEQQLIEALPKVAKASSSPKLREAIEEHLKETKGHAQRLEKVFRAIDVKPHSQHCDGMQGLIAEGEEIIAMNGDPAARDAALIAAAQRVEHYEIAAYGTARSIAEQLGYPEAAELLRDTLDEESAADEKLTGIATSGVNERAA